MQKKTINKIFFLIMLLSAFLYHIWRRGNPLDLGETDYWYIMLICPVLTFGVIYFISKCVFGFSVCAVEPKAVRMIFVAEVFTLGIYGSSVLLFFAFNVTNLWLEYRFLQRYYSWLFMFCSSSPGIAFCVFMAVFLAFAVTAKEI